MYDFFIRKKLAKYREYRFAPTHLKIESPRNALNIWNGFFFISIYPMNNNSPSDHRNQIIRQYPPLLSICKLIFLLF